MHLTTFSDKKILSLKTLENHYSATILISQQRIICQFVNV